MNASMSCELMLLGKLPSTIRTLKIKKKKNEKTFKHSLFSMKPWLKKISSPNFDLDFSTIYS